jgi:uncharacterized protein YndB with AHSA1/START domain
MARNVQYIDAPPQRIFDVLSNADNYAYWVVGSKCIRGVDGPFPEPGTRFHHKVGLGPLEIADHTAVLESEPPKKLVLHAKARPLGTAIVKLLLEPSGPGTRVTMIEDGGDPLTRLVFLNPAVQLATKARNVESLRRLKDLAERSG